ncbi:MAG: response regulator [Planctomycetaceae bacterium]|nr:response regulator [Planctomycetaceae bacterium]
MTDSLRIAIADDDPEQLLDLEETLNGFGHQAIIKASTGEQLVEECHKEPPDLIITDIRFPGIDGLEAVAHCRDDHPVPIVILSAFHTSELMDRAIKEHVMAYLVKPANEESLEAAIELAMQRFKEFRALQLESESLRQALEDRKVIERAKGILMSRTKLSEKDAFKRLQLLSSQKNIKLIEIAKTIIEAEDAFNI